MKLEIFLTVFYEANSFKNNKLDLELVELDNKKAETKGKVSLILHGKSISKFLTFDQTNFKKYQTLILKTDFSEDVTHLTVMWKSKSKKPLYLNYFNAIVDDEHFYIFSMERNIQSGTFEEFYNTKK